MQDARVCIYEFEKPTRQHHLHTLTPPTQTIFEASPSVAHYAAPLLFIHPSQLVIGSLLVPALSRY